MALQEAKTFNINRQSVYYVTAGVADIPTTGDVFNVGDWVVNINPTMAVGDVLTWVCSAASGNTPTFTAMSYVGAVKGVLVATSSTTISTTVGTVLANATSAGFTITLPTMGTSAGQAYAGYGVTVLKTDSSANTVTVAPVSSSTLDGLSSEVLETQYQGIDYRATGTSNGVWYKATDFPVAQRSANSPQTITTSDRIYLASTAGTVTIPAAASWPLGRILYMGTGATITVTPVSGTVTGVGASITMTTGQSSNLVSDGTNYWLV